MKIAVVNLDNGGIMHYAVDLVNSLSKKGIDTMYIGYYEADELLNNKCKKIYINKRDFKNLRKCMIQLCKNKEIDVIHFSGYHIFFVLICKLVKRYKVKVVYTIHDARIHPTYSDANIISINNIKQKIIYSDFLRKYLARSADTVITLSEYVRELVREIFKIESEVILLSQDIERYGKVSSTFDIKNKKVLKILFFGIVDKYKGIEDLLEALCIVKKESDSFELTIAGKSKCEEVNIPIDIRKNTKWINRFILENEIAELFINSDIVVLPYKEVSQSGVISMAMAYNKPVICTKIGSFTEYVIDGYNGFLVKKDSPSEISDKIKYLINNYKEINSIEHNCKKIYCEKLNWNVLSEKYINIYKSLTKVK